MKKILILFSMLLLFACAPNNNNLDEKFRIENNEHVTYCDNQYYFYDDGKLVSISKDNKKTEYGNYEIVKEKENIYINKNNDKKLLGINEELVYTSDVEFYEDGRVEIKFFNSSDYVTSIFTDKKYLNLEPHIFNAKNNFYLIVLNYHHSAYIDLSINGEDYIESKIYRVNQENKQLELIYSTDNTKAIACGDEKVIYYADDKYDIYRLDLITNKEELVYDTPGDDGIRVDYTHNKLFIFDNYDNIGIIDVD